MIFRGAVTRFAAWMTGRAIIVLGFVRVKRTGRVTFVLVHHQMMLAAGALVRSVLAAGAIGLAGHTRAVLRICER